MGASQTKSEVNNTKAKENKEKAPAKEGTANKEQKRGGDVDQSKECLMNVFVNNYD